MFCDRFPPHFKARPQVVTLLAQFPTNENELAINKDMFLMQLFEFFQIIASVFHFDKRSRGDHHIIQIDVDIRNSFIENFFLYTSTKFSPIS